MPFLILSVSAGTIFGQLLKWTVVRKSNLYVATAANYVVATTLTLLAGLLRDESWSESATVAYITVPGGLFFVASFVTWMLSMARGGLYVSNVIFQLAVAVPVVAGILVWREMPDVREWGGLLMLVPALALLAHRRAASVQSATPWSPGLALALFLTTGLALTTIKLKPHLELQNVGFLYFHWVFAAAGIGALVMCFTTGAKVTGFPVAVGAGIGVANALTVMSLSWALSAGVPAYVVFPVQAGGTILTATLLALLAWKETFSWRGGVGLACAVVAVVLLTV
jgi:drug/metabolite transporter (DMT)-like permease